MVKYDPRTGTLTGRIREYHTDKGSGNFVTRFVETTLTFPTDGEGHTLEPYRFDYDDGRHKDAYPTENYDDYRSSHSGLTGKFRRLVTLGRTRHGTKIVHNAKFVYRQWYDKLTKSQRRLIGELNHETFTRGHGGRYGHEVLAASQAAETVTTLRPGHRTWNTR